MYVYRFLNKNNEIIYIGKAKNLNFRIKNHKHLPKECYNEINKIEYIKLNNCDESSIYERYLINKINPKYNTQYNNESSFSFELPELKWIEFTENKKKCVKKQYKFVETASVNKMNPYFKELVNTISENNREREFYTLLFCLFCNKYSLEITIDKYLFNFKNDEIINFLNKLKKHSIVISNLDCKIIKSFKIKDGCLSLFIDGLIIYYLCFPENWPQCSDILMNIDNSEYGSFDIYDTDYYDDKFIEKKLKEKVFFFVRDNFKYYKDNNYMRHLCKLPNITIKFT